MEVVKMETIFLRVVCPIEDAELVTEVLDKENFNDFTVEKKGSKYIFHLRGLEEEITRVSCSLISLRSSLPVDLEMHDDKGVIA
jgi:hypothetical protein